MSLNPDYNVPELSNQKWDDIECWRNDMLPTFIGALHWAGADIAHWRIVSVVFDQDINISQITLEAPSGDQLKVEPQYSNDTIQLINFSYKRISYPGVFEPTTPGTVTLVWVDGFLTTYTWS